MDTRTRQLRQLILALVLPVAICALFLFSTGWEARALASGRDAHDAHGSLPAVPRVTGTPCGEGAGWNMVPAPDGGSYSNALYGVAALSQSDAWTVGEQYDSGFGFRPMIEHWNGTAWSVVTAAQYGTTLRGVAAIASNDVWAVGWMGGYSTQPLTEHWNGSQWTYVQASASGARKLYGVAAVSSNDAWAVGQSTAGLLILHWNGAQWSLSATPGIPTGVLYGVTAISANDVWAVGTSNNAETVTLHWDGSQWTRVTSPNSGAYINVLTVVTSVSSGDVWAAGYWATSGVDYHGYTLHWDGSQWSANPNPTNPDSPNARPDDPVPAGTYLYGVSAAPNGDVWAVGQNLQTAGATGVTIHLQGGNWTAVQSPNPGFANTHLYAVSALGSSGAWAVGNYDTSSSGYTVPSTERFIPSTCPTETPGVPTNTRTPMPTSVATNTPILVNTPTPCGNGAGWNVVPAPDGGSYSNALYGVAALSQSDAWTVGEQYDSVFGFRPMIEHWNGAAWSVVTAAQYGTTLRGVAAIASNDVWAVGWMGGYSTQPLTEHWNGSQWTYVQASASGARKLYGVAAVSSNDAWAVGQSTAGLLILHWNGVQWSLSATPGIPTGVLYGVTAISANDVWAVGTSNNAETVTLHWDGSQWTRVTSPNSGAYINVLTAATSTASNDVWAVGYWATSGVDYHGYALHWDGAQWSAIINPSQGEDPVQTGTYLYGVSAAPNGDVWMVGRNLRANGATGVTMRFDGDSWIVAPNPNPGSANTNFYAVTASAGSTDVWAVGNYDVGQYGYTYPLTEHYGGACATPTAAPSTVTATPSPQSTNPPAPTNTTPPGQPTNTRPVATNTAAIPTSTSTSVPNATDTPTNEPGLATSTPGICSVQFIDVPSGSAFYGHIICLACRGIMSGYPDSTFRPNNEITRGQLSKVVSNSAGYIEQPTGQTFQDVASTHTFYLYIERMASRGLIIGYACGSQSEPCGPGNKPYFRPGANATRGQITKIVSNGAGFSDTPSARMFEDVPTTNTFYLYVERLAERGIIGGYPCGGQGEPCGPENRPYFRPGANTTRGQTAKIAANAFFPNCVSSR